MKYATLAAEESLYRGHGLAAPWPGRRVLLDGSTVYVRDTPPVRDGLPPALYLHGLGGSSQNWTDLAGLLAHRLAGQAIDLPGFGLSDPADRYTVRALARRVIRWIEYAGRGPVHLFGNSLGGAIAVRVAATRPDLVRTLTLISPALPFLDPRRSVQGRFVPLLAVPGIARIAARRLAGTPAQQLVRMAVEVCFADPARLHPTRWAEAEQEALRRASLPHYADAYVRTLRALVATFLCGYLPGADSLWRAAARVAAPTLVIGGREDRLVDIRVPARAAAVMRDARLLLLDDVGHVAQMEVPEVVARAVITLLDEVAGERGRLDRDAPALATPRQATTSGSPGPEPPRRALSRHRGARAVGGHAGQPVVGGDNGARRVAEAGPRSA